MLGRSRAVLVASLVLFACLLWTTAAYATAEVEPNNTTSTANFCPPGAVFTASITPAGDADYFVCTLTQGRVYTISAIGNSGFDPKVTIVDASGALQFAMDQQLVYQQGLVRPNDCEFEFCAPQTAIYYYQVRKGAYGASATGSYTFSLTDVGQHLTPTLPLRFGGADRYEVAANGASFAYGGGDYSAVRHVVIASGRDAAMADPLAASALAGAYDAPLLLVRGDWPHTLPASTAGQLAHIRSDIGSATLYIHIVGGPATVPDSLKAHLSSAAGSAVVDRIGGADRYAVAANVAARIRTVLGLSYPRTCFIANGQNPATFYDALACGPIAYKKHWPILLVRNGGVIPAVTATAKGSYSARYVVSTGNAVPSSASGPLGATMRLTGSDRTQMARALAEEATIDPAKHWIGNETSPDHWAWRLMLTNKVADALTSCQVGGRLEGVVLYCTDASHTSPQPKEYGAHNWWHSLYDVWIVGGPASVTDGVRLDFAKACGYW